MTALLVLLWPVLLLLGVTGGVGVLGGFCVHWWLELRALRPAYLAERGQHPTAGYPGG